MLRPFARSLKKQLTFREATTGFPRNDVWGTSAEIPYWWRVTAQIGSASDWLRQIFNAAWPMRGSSQIWVVTRHWYGISALVSQTSFRLENQDDVAKCRLFSQATPRHRWETIPPFHLRLLKTTWLQSNREKCDVMLPWQQNFWIQKIATVVTWRNDFSLFQRGHKDNYHLSF